MTPSSARLTTNIKISLKTFLEKEAQKRNTTTRMILEEAVTVYEREQRKEKMIAAYNEMADSPEMQECLDIANNPINLMTGLEDLPPAEIKI